MFMIYDATNDKAELERSKRIDADRAHGHIPADYGCAYKLECSMKDMRLRAKLDAKGIN